MSSTSNIIVLDYNKNFKEEDVKKFVDSGVDTILAFDWWWKTEPSPGVYDFDDWLHYEDMLKRNGVKLLIQTPMGTPFWANDPAWYLSNYYNQKNDFAQWTKLYNIKDPMPFCHFFILCGRIFSYWNPEAEDYVRKYIRKIRETLKYSTCIPSIGECGEFLFPPIAGMMGACVYPTPWWFDSFAQQKCQESGKVAEEWIVGELSRISKERINLYQEKWLQYVPYYNNGSFGPAMNWGNVGCENVILENKEDLTTILFSAFYDMPNWLSMATAQARICPTYAGAEGAENVVENAHKAKNLGFRGLICGTMNIMHCGLVNSVHLENWVFDNVKKANKIWLLS
ncbi:MAG: beta-galactosidase [Proteobacteria bacterium]|jgi:hypothetical protein|nr:beta-galactosidase [Pseudomonadota bacterium]